MIIKENSWGNWEGRSRGRQHIGNVRERKGGGKLFNGILIKIDISETNKCRNITHIFLLNLQNNVFMKVFFCFTNKDCKSYCRKYYFIHSSEMYVMPILYLYNRKQRYK